MVCRRGTDHLPVIEVKAFRAIIPECYIPDEKCSLELSGIKDCLDTIDFLDEKIQEMDNQIKILASNDKYVKHVITIPGISYYAASLISSEIADINSRYYRYQQIPRL